MQLQTSRHRPEIPNPDLSTYSEGSRAPKPLQQVVTGSWLRAQHYLPASALAKNPHVRAAHNVGSSCIKRTRAQSIPHAIRQPTQPTLNLNLHVTDHSVEAKPINLTP